MPKDTTEEPTDAKTATATEETTATVVEDYPTYLARTGATVPEAPEPAVVEDYPAYLARKAGK